MTRCPHTCMLITLFVLCLALPAAWALEPGPYRTAVRTGTISSPEITEASGISASRVNRSILWVVNDSGNPAALYAISRRGERLHKFIIKDKAVRTVKNTDWEDLAGFEHQGAHFLVIADVGDNRARRQFCSLLFVKEPSLDRGAKEKDGGLTVQWKMTFRYEDGPRDCESVAVDIRSMRILLLSKRTNPPVMYELPLVVNARETVYTARPVAAMPTIPRPTPKDLKEPYGRYRSLPTSMDLSVDGSTLVVLTYKDAYLFRRETGTTWGTALASPPRIIRLPHPNTGELVQREAICLDHETGQLIVTSEKAAAPIYVLDPVE